MALFAQYPSTTVGYGTIAGSVSDVIGNTFMPNSYINAKGTVPGLPNTATGLFIRSDNSSNLPDVGLTIVMDSTSKRLKYGIHSSGVFNIEDVIIGMASNFTNSSTTSATSMMTGFSTSLTGKTAWGYESTVNINSPSSTGKGGDFYVVPQSTTLVPDGEGTAKGLETYANAGTSYGILAEAAGTSDTKGNAYGIYAKASGARNNYAGYFDGNVTVTGMFTNPSDGKLKKNIQGIESALDKVMQLAPSNYEFKTESYAAVNLGQGKHYGFIAQDLEKVFPELVSENSMVVNRTKAVRRAGNDLSSKNTQSKHASEETVTYENIKAVNYLEMIPILTKALQEQQAMIVALQEEIQQLKKGK